MTNQEWIETVILVSLFSVYVYVFVFGWLEQYSERNRYLGRKTEVKRTTDR